MPLLIALGIIAIVFGGLLIPNKAWALPARANPYAADIMAAERTHGMPRNLFARLLWQESRFRPDIIDGTVRGPAGSIGIAQLNPRFHTTVDPTNPIESIYYGANYLAQQKQRFGSWIFALAAYNFGPTAVEKKLREHGTLWFRNLPQSTQDYIREITNDVPEALA